MAPWAFGHQGDNYDHASDPKHQSGRLFVRGQIVGRRNRQVGRKQQQSDDEMLFRLHEVVMGERPRPLEDNRLVSMIKDDIPVTANQDGEPHA